MNSSFRLLKPLRILLFPFSLLYGLVVIARNFLYDKNVIKSVSFNLPIIAVGNLSVGGTGKSPMVEHLLTLIKGKYRTATLSRGYKRKRRGYALAGADTTVFEIGDEPMQFHRKFPDVSVAVGEERILAIPQLMQDRPDTEVIVLDDSYQHRIVKPGFNILLTEYRNLFTRDFFLPTGSLRDQKSSYERADVIVVTKCPVDLTEEKKGTVKKEIDPLPYQKVFFTALEYGFPYHLITGRKEPLAFCDEVLLISGIANPILLKSYVNQQVKNCDHLSFSDHHIFSHGDIALIKKKFNDIKADKKIIITTEKDAARLASFEEELVSLPVYVLPVKHKFLFGEGMQFDSIVNTFIQRFPGDKK